MKPISKRTVISASVLSLALLAIAPTAQEPAEDKKPVDAAAKVTPEARFKALESRAEAIYNTWLEGLRAKRKAGEELTDADYEIDYGTLLDEFDTAAKDYAGTDHAIAYLGWLAGPGMRADEKRGKAAVETLFTAHVKSAKLVDVAGMIGSLGYFFDDKAKAEKIWKQLAAENPDVTVQAWATYSMLEDVLKKSAADSEEFKKAKLTLMGFHAKIKDDYLKNQIESTIKVQETFGFGMVAPDITGTDLDGVDFKLSDYKGQVIFLDFWGDW